MRHPLVEPRQRGALERPADGDPLVIELQRDGDGDEGERRAGDERQAGHVALSAPFEAQQRAQQEGGDRAEQDRDHADHPLQAGGDEGLAAGDERHRRRSERNHPRLPTLVLPRTRDQGVGGEERVESTGEREQLWPLRRVKRLPLRDGVPGDDEDTRCHPRPACLHRQRQQHRDIGDVHREQRANGAAVVPLDRKRPKGKAANSAVSSLTNNATAAPRFANSTPPDLAATAIQASA